MMNLPYEIRRLISIQASRINHETLRSLTLVNRDWYDAAVPLLYCSLVIKFVDLPSLKEAVYQITRHEFGQKYLEHARRLDIIATQNLPSRTKEERRTFQDVYGMGCNLINLEDFGLDITGSFIGQSFARWCDLCLDQTVLNPGHYYEHDWSPLELLLSRLTKVKELNYGVDNVFPECLFNAIHEFHPKCQLNIWNCQSLSPGHPQKGRVRSTSAANSNIDPFDMALLRSPCINTIKFDYGIASYSSDSSQSRQQEAMLPVLNIPPNLKHIYIVLQPGRAGSIDESNQHWAEFFSSHPASALTSTRASPVSLAIDKDGIECQTLFTNLHRSMDFSSLRCLRLGAFNPIDVKEVSPAFSCLDTLSINLDITPWASYTQAHFKSMFESFRPLKFLGIQGFCSKDVIESILSRHGSTLQSLILQKSECHFSYQLNFTGGYYHYPVFNVRDIADIARRAPHLRDLRIQLKRPGKEEQELAFYDALGQFSALRNLAIDFDCSATQFPERKTLAKNPVDETLAARIWDSISAYPTSWLLCNLHIMPFGKDSLTPFDFAVLLQRSKSLLMSRTSDGGRTIREVGQTEREAQCKQQWDLVNQQISSSG